MSNNNIDKKIRQALMNEDVAVFDEFSDEQSPFDQAMQLLKGRNRLLNLLAMFVTLIFMAVGVTCLWRFIAAEETKELLGWAMGLAFSLSAVSMIKLWAWMEIEKNSTIREIKRLELQVAHLCKKLDANRTA